MTDRMKLQEEVAQRVTRQLEGTRDISDEQVKSAAQAALQNMHDDGTYPALR